MITKEKRKEYRQNFIDKIGKEEFKKYLAKHSRNYRIKNNKKLSEKNKKWREDNPDYNKKYYLKTK